MTKKESESRMEKYHSNSTEIKKETPKKASYDKGFTPKYDTEKTPKEKFNWKLVFWTFIGGCGAIILLATFLNATQPDNSAQHQRAVRNEKIQKSQTKIAEKQAQQNTNPNQVQSNNQDENDSNDYYAADDEQQENPYPNRQIAQTTAQQNQQANYQRTQQNQQPTTQGAGYYETLDSAQQAGIQAVDSGTASNYQVVNNGKGYTLILEH